MLAPMVPRPMNPICMTCSLVCQPARRWQSPYTIAAIAGGLGRRRGSDRTSVRLRRPRWLSPPLATSIVLEDLDDGRAQDHHEQDREEEDDHRHGQLRRQGGCLLLGL